MASQEEVPQLYFFSNHKSGTSFIHKALIHFTKLNKIPYYSSPLARRLIDKNNKNQNIHKIDTGIAEVYFYRNSEYSELVKHKIVKGIRVIRNPLSVVKSAYFSHLNTHREIGWPKLQVQRKLLKQLSFEEGINKTILFLEDNEFFPNTAGPLNTIKTWPVDDQRFLTLRMEDITLDPTAFFKTAIAYFGLSYENLRFVPEHMLSFEYQSGGRKQGEVDEGSHLRSGDPNEWKTILPKEAQDYLFSEYSDFIQQYYPESLCEQPLK